MKAFAKKQTRTAFFWAITLPEILTDVSGQTIGLIFKVWVFW
jgi:hypothetical protein